MWGYCNEDGALWVLDGTTGAVICGVDDSEDYTVYDYMFIEDDTRIITSGDASSGSLTSIRCFCAISGHRIRAHWAEANNGKFVCGNFTADKIVFSCLPNGRDSCIECVAPQGVEIYSGKLSVPGSLFFFTDENTVASVSSFFGSRLPVISLVNIATGEVSQFTAETGPDSVVGNGGSKILIGHGAGVYVISTCPGEVGKVLRVIEEPPRDDKNRVMCTCGVDLDSVILM
jgi:hypothetical protein